MGHLISARAFRLGISFEWVDVWFAKSKQSYIFILFTCFRLRYFFLSFMYSKKRDKANLFYSHVELMRKRRFLYLSIFFYDSQLPNIIDLFGESIYKYLSSKIYKFFIDQSNINKDGLGLLLDSDVIAKGKKKYNRFKNIWLNNYLYFKNLLWIHPNSSMFYEKSLIFHKTVNNLFHLFSYKQINHYLNNDFSVNLKANKGLIQKLRKYSLISSFFKNYCKDIKNLPFFLLNVSSKYKDLSNLFFLKKKQKNPFYFINKWYSFSSLDFTILNVAFIKDFINRSLLKNGKIFKFLNRYNKVISVNLNNLNKIINSSNLSDLSNLSQKYKDFIGFISFKFKKRNWFWQYSLKSIYYLFNHYLFNHYSVFSSNAGLWRHDKKMSLNIKKQSSTLKSYFFNDFSSWKSFYNSSLISSSNKLSNKFKAKAKLI